MNSDGSPPHDAAAGVDPLWDELARDHRDRMSVVPVLRYLVGGDSHDLFGEEPVARTRAMIEALAMELLRLDDDNPSAGAQAALTAALADQPGLIGHVHAMAIEGRIVARLAARGIDPLLPPLVQDRISSPDPQIAGLAMTLMAAQTRFVRRHQRMELVAAELPADLLHAALSALGAIERSGAGRGVADLRAGFDERRGRLGILAQLGLGLGDDFPAALDPASAGFSLFASALSLITGHDRDDVVLAAASPRPFRLALLLAAAGVDRTAREATLLLLCPDVPVPSAWLALAPADASALLAQAMAG